MRSKLSLMTFKDCNKKLFSGFLLPQLIPALTKKFPIMPRTSEWSEKLAKKKKLNWWEGSRNTSNSFYLKRNFLVDPIFSAKHLLKHFSLEATPQNKKFKLVMQFFHSQFESRWPTIPSSQILLNILSPKFLHISTVFLLKKN